MPLYDYRCECGQTAEVYCRVADHEKTKPCTCGKEMRQVIHPLHVVEDIKPYRSVVTGERIKGRAHHRVHLRDHNLVEIGNEKQEFKETPMPPAGPDIKRAIEELS